jgi:chromosome segregation ATPase
MNDFGQAADYRTVEQWLNDAAELRARIADLEHTKSSLLDHLEDSEAERDELEQACDRLQEERDELLAALIQVRSEMRARGCISGKTQDAADAAIAKAESRE